MIPDGFHNSQKPEGSYDLGLLCLHQRSHHGTKHIQTEDFSAER